MEPVTEPLEDFEEVYDDEAFEAYASIHFRGGGPSERSFFPGGGGRDRAGGAGGGDAGFPRQQRARQLAAATRADVDAVPRLAALGSLFCEEEDVRMGRPSAAAVQEAKHEKEKEGKEKGKGKK